MADGLSRGDAAGSSKLRLLYIMQNGTRVGLSCVCVCAGIHCHLAGYTATHHAVHCLRNPSLNLEILYNLILYIIWSRVGGILSLVACVAPIAVSLQSQSQCRSSTVTFTGSSAGNEELALGVTPDFQFQLAPLSPFSLSLSVPPLPRYLRTTCARRATGAISYAET